MNFRDNLYQHQIKILLFITKVTYDLILGYLETWYTMDLQKYLHTPMTSLNKRYILSRYNILLY